MSHFVTISDLLDTIGMKSDLISFHDLYKRYSQDVGRFAFWLCGDKDDAKDLASETFIRVWTAGKQVHANTVRAYLFTITRNLFLQRQRRQKRQTFLDHNIIDDLQSPERITENRSELAQVFRAMQSLTESERAALLLRGHEDLAYEEIAMILNISLAAVKVKIHRARIKLSLLMAEEEI